jgi:hypothetical protein
VTRLWNRVGLYRSLALLVLVGGLAGGVAVAADGPSQQTPPADAASNAQPLNVADLERQDVERAEAERAARDNAQRKADEAAVAAAEQAKKSPSASTSSSKKSTTGGNPGQPVGPVPAGCGEFTGNRKTGCTLMVAAGYGLDQWPCLDKLFKRESGWNEKARNPGSGAYGIPQALPGSKMASIAGDWQTNPATQVRWGLGYIKDRYGSPCGAWNHSENTGWY